MIDNNIYILPIFDPITDLCCSIIAFFIVITLRTGINLVSSFIYLIINNILYQFIIEKSLLSACGQVVNDSRLYVCSLGSYSDMYFWNIFTISDSLFCSYCSLLFHYTSKFIRRTCKYIMNNIL